MIGVLVWLSTGAFLALVITLRLGLTTATALLRLRPVWFGVLFLVVLSDQFEALEGYNDPDDPMAAIPRVVKWAWFAALAASVHHRARLVSVPLLALAHLTAVAYIAGAGEVLLYSDGASRAAWLADRATLTVGLAQSVWSSIGLEPSAFPSHIFAELLMSLAPFAIAAALLLLLLWCYALIRSATLNTVGCAPLPPLVLRPLGFTGFTAALILWVGGDLLSNSAFGFALAVGDLGRVVWLYHLMSSVVWLHRRRMVPGFPGVVVVLLLTLPAAASLVIATAGMLIVSWGYAGRTSRSARWLKALTHLGAIAAAAVVYLILRSTELSVENPQDLRSNERGHHVQAHAIVAADYPAAERQCRRSGATVCSLAQWRNNEHVRETARGWEWVAIPSAGQTVSGLARVYTVGGERPVMAVHDALRDKLDADEVGVRCCR